MSYQTKRQEGGITALLVLCYSCYEMTFFN